MKKSIINLCLVGFLLFFGVLSCKKSTDNSSPSKRTQLLTQAAWKYVMAESKTGAGPWMDVTSSYTPCKKDDITIFRLNGTYEIDEGATKCSPTDPQIYSTAAWVFLNNEMQVKISSIGGFAFYYIESIDQLDENSLIITFSDIVNVGTYHRTTYGH